MARVVIGVTGASGVVLAHRAIGVLTHLKHRVDLIFSKSALLTASQEMGKKFSKSSSFIDSFSNEQKQYIFSYSLHDFCAPFASGSFQHDGMLVLPCSMASLSAIAWGYSDNLLRRAADVTLKERRKLVLVPRETPLHETHLENMLKVTRMGGVILPPVPAWYNGTQTLEDVENFIVGRTLDSLGISTNIYQRWEGKRETSVSSEK